MIKCFTFLISLVIITFTASAKNYLPKGLVISGVNRHVASVNLLDPIVSFADSTDMINEAAGSFDVQLTITNPSSDVTTATIGIYGGTATSPADFTLSATTVNFPSNSSAPEYITINLVQDMSPEAIETVILQIEFVNNDGSIGIEFFTLYIEDTPSDPPLLQFYPVTYSTPENVDSLAIQVQIGLPNALETTVDLMVVPAGTSATEGVDFPWNPITVTFPAGGDLSQIVYIHITDDLVDESDETIKLKLTNPVNGVIDQFWDTVLITIVDDDLPVLTVAFESENASVNEDAGSLSLNVIIGNPNSNATSVDIDLIIGGSATANSDFSWTGPVTVTFPASTSAAQTVSIPITDDAIYEGDETFSLHLTNPTNGASLSASLDTFLVTIIENDPTAIASLEQYGISAFPNPASDYCVINTNDLVKRCDVYNSTGQLMLTSEPYANRLKLDVQNLSSGLYLIEAVTEHGILHYKLMKK